MQLYSSNPVTFWENEKNTSVKKVWLHIDVFFYKEQGSIREVVYVTTVTPSDQGLSETLFLLKLTGLCNCIYMTLLHSKKVPKNTPVKKV